MSDEPKTDETPAEWSMPEPVFRSTDGRTPKGAAAMDIGNDDTTQPGFNSAPTVEIECPLTPDTEETGGNASVNERVSLASNAEEKPAKKRKVKVQAKAPAAKKPKKRGCLSKFLYLILTIGMLAAAAIVALIYWLFYYRPTDTGTFN